MADDFDVEELLEAPFVEKVTFVSLSFQAHIVNFPLINLFVVKQGHR